MTDPIELPSLSEASPPGANPPPPRPRGGQHGNRNAFKHGFYARAFSSSEVKDIEIYTFRGQLGMGPVRT
jgi:hypothetical protein